VTFKVVPGEKVGVCGRTGAGKSSLIQCVFRMVTLAGGAIEVDGVDTRDIPLPVLRGKLGMVPQDSWLFSGTLRSNLDVFNQYTDAEIWATLELVNLAPSIKSYEEGLSKEVEEKGTNFSVGTVQLICLARVLLKKPKIIFMDEATASVDLETDSLVQDTIRKAFSECTIITIAHRILTIIDFDKVLVLNFGKVVEYGAPNDLLSDSFEFFSNLVDSTGKESAKELRSRASKAAK